MLLLLVFTGCSKDDEQKNAKLEADKKAQQSEVVERKINVEITIPVRKIDKLNVENAVQVFLSLQEHQIKWMVELNQIAKEKGMDHSQISEGEQEGSGKIVEIKEMKEKEFFKNWGLSKEVFEKFFQENGDRVQLYIAKDEKLQSFLEDLQQKTQQLYMTGEGLGEDEGYDEEQ